MRLVIRAWKQLGRTEFFPGLSPKGHCVEGGKEGGEGR